MAVTNNFKGFVEPSIGQNISRDQVSDGTGNLNQDLVSLNNKTLVYDSDSNLIATLQGVRLVEIRNGVITTVTTSVKDKNGQTITFSDITNPGGPRYMEDSDGNYIMWGNAAEKDVTNNTTTVVNSYSYTYTNNLNSSSTVGLGEQRIFNSMIKETINQNGLTLRYMPRYSKFKDNIFNEQPEGLYHQGLLLDVMMISTTGFGGDGQTMTQYGLEFREEMEIAVNIERFDELYGKYYDSLTTDEQGKFKRWKPYSGDLIVIPFGRAAEKDKFFYPKVFEILSVTQSLDGQMFYPGENYQYKLRCQLFEMSWEDMLYRPTATRNNVATVGTNSTSDVSNIAEGIGWIDSEGQTYDVVDSDLTVYNPFSNDPIGHNKALESRSQVQKNENIVTADETPTKKLKTNDLTAFSFGVKDLDEI